VSVIWHDLECGGYAADLPLWRGLAEQHGAPVLDVGAGTGRVALALARAGHAVIALDRDPELLSELRRRAGGLDRLQTELADARQFDLRRRFPLCIVPMQTVQLLGGPDGRIRFLRCARAHLSNPGILAIALADELELFEVAEGAPSPLSDVCELDGVVYSSRPTAVRAERDGYVLERRRETVTIDGRFSAQRDQIRLDRLDAAQLEREAAMVGLRPAGRTQIAPTADHVGSVVVMFGV
jgi:SAM-dependent methyltransferase